MKETIMSECANCGRGKSTATKVVLWCVGLCVAAVVGIPVTLVVLLAAVATIGRQAGSEIDSQSNAAAMTQVSQTVEPQSIVEPVASFE